MRSRKVLQTIFQRLPSRSQTITFMPRRYFSSFKIYTKTGDKGTSALYTGDRFDKNSSIFYCLGSIDEVNANIGLAREFCLTVENLKSSNVHHQLEEI